MLEEHTTKNVSFVEIIIFIFLLYLVTIAKNGLIKIQLKHNYYLASCR